MTDEEADKVLDEEKEFLAACDKAALEFFDKLIAEGVKLGTDRKVVVSATISTIVRMKKSAVGAAIKTLGMSDKIAKEFEEVVDREY